MQLHYFPIRGLGEMIRVFCAFADIELEEVAVNYGEMKSDFDQYPFAQCPRLVDGEVNLTQSHAILRYLGRKSDCYGATPVEAAQIDMMLDGFAALRKSYLELIYTHALEEGKRVEHWAHRGDPNSMTQRNGGAHWGYISRLLLKNAADGKGPIVGSKVSIADCELFELTDLYLRIFPEQMAKQYPAIVAHHTMMGETKGISAYLASGKRHAKVNNNSLG